MLALIRRIFSVGRQWARPTVPSDDDDGLDWLEPPRDMQDAEAWDAFWRNQVNHGLGPPIYDMFVCDEALVRRMRERGLQTVLCAGNGISKEPWALCEAGFHVTALDISPVAEKVATACELDTAYQDMLIGSEPGRPDGRIDYVVGNLQDGSVCPGPFDAIIERRTLQLFPEEERPGALDALLRRLADNGILLSHCHDGAWTPPAKPYHATASLLRGRGLSVFSGDEEFPDSGGQVAWIVTSTG